MTAKSGFTALHAWSSKTHVYIRNMSSPTLSASPIPPTGQEWLILDSWYWTEASVSPRDAVEIRDKLLLHVYMFWSVSTHVTCMLHMDRVTGSCTTTSHSCTSAITLIGHCPNVLESNGEPRGNIYHPNKLNTPGASNPRGTNRWAEHESGAFISPFF